MNIAENIRQERALLRLSQEEMAEKLGISQRVYSNIENGRTKRVDANVLKAFELLKSSNANINTEMPGGEVIELLIGLQARTTVLQAQLISWASKMKDDPGELMMRLQQAEQKEVSRLLDERRRKQK